MSRNLEKKLVDEKFNGKPINWQEGHSGGIPVETAWDDKNYYYKQGNQIFVQTKEGSNEEVIHSCYKCGEKAKVLETWSGPIHGRQPGVVLSEGGTSSRLYCIKCEGPVKEDSYRKLLEINIV